MRDASFSVDGCTLRYLEWPSEGPSLVLLPGSGGMGGSPLQWRGFADAMRDRRRVIILTMRGHAGSEWKPPYVGERFARDLGVFVEAMGLAPVDVVAHSSAAGWAWLYATSRPRLLRRLVLVDPGFPERGPDRRPPLLRERTWPSQDAIVTECRERWRIDPAADGDFVAAVRDGTHQLPDATWTWRMDPRLHEAGRRGEWPSGEDLVGRSRDVVSPTLFILREGYDFAGEHPGITQGFPTARFVHIPRAGHVVHLSAPTSFGVAVRGWLLAPDAEPGE